MTRTPKPEDVHVPPSVAAMSRDDKAALFVKLGLDLLRDGDQEPFETLSLLLGVAITIGGARPATRKRAKREGVSKDTSIQR